MLRPEPAADFGRSKQAPLRIDTFFLLGNPKQKPAILYPVFALASWTFLVLLLIPFYRVGAGLRREVEPDDFKYGESATVPP